MAFHDDATVEARDCCPCPLPGKPLPRVSVLPAVRALLASSGSSAKEHNNDDRPAVAEEVLSWLDPPPYLMEARRAGRCFGIVCAAVKSIDNGPVRGEYLSVTLPVLAIPNLLYPRKID